MAVNAKAYSPKEFSFLIAEQDDFGVLNLDSGGDSTSWVAVDVDSVGTPSMNLNQVLDQRTGSRVLQATDFFQDNKGKVIEVSVSGTLTTEVADLLLGNITEGSIIGDTTPYKLLSNATSQNFTNTTENQTASQILSICYQSPASGHSIGLKDCFCTSLSLNGDAGTEGGRVKFSATFKTGSLPTLTQGALTIDTPISSNNYYMSSWTAAERQIVGITNTLVNTFTLNIENDTVFAGITSTGYESVSRVGEISATADFNVKYDDNTDVLFENFHDQVTGASEGNTLMSADGTLSNGSFEFSFPKSILTNVAFSEGDMMALDLSVKALGSGIDSTTALVEVSC